MEITMASSRTTFEKLQRDRAKAAKKALKQQKRVERKADEVEETMATERSESPLVPDKKSLSPGELLATVERLHTSFANDEISFDEFEEAKAELMAMIQVD
jgi:hypothetical protein